MSERKKKKSSLESQNVDLESLLDTNPSQQDINYDIKVFCFYFNQIKGGIIVCFLMILLIFLLCYSGIVVLTGSWMNSDFLD